MHFNAYFYDEMTFILVNGETSKQQEKQLFGDWCSVNLKMKRTQYKYVLPHDGKFEYETNSTQMRFVELKLRMLRTKETQHENTSE